MIELCNTTAGELVCSFIFVCGNPQEEIRLRTEMIEGFCERNEIETEDLMKMRVQDIIFIDFYRTNKTAFNTLMDVYRAFVEEYKVEQVTEKAVYKMRDRLITKKNGYKKRA